MYNRENLHKDLENKKFDERLASVYVTDTDEALESQKKRIEEIVVAFDETFPENTSEEIGIFSAPGRTEIGGNHTDHQLGSVLAGSVNYDIIAAVAPNGEDKIRFYSDGYGMTEIDLKDLEKKDEEEETTASLIRGMAHYINELGHDINGFDAYSVSNVPGGSGISSSAAFETLIGTILNVLSAEESLDSIEIAKLGQKTENNYFGKPSGLMDQMASSVGGIVAIDFKDKENPVVEPVQTDFNDFDHVLVITDTKSSHADLTDEYASIPEDMKKVARALGKELLSEVDEEEFLSSLPQLREQLPDRAVLRALHYFNDTQRAKREAKALSEGDFEEFLRLVNESGNSSILSLQNIWPAGAVEDQSVAVALTLSKQALDGRGATRVHGGGFAGTIQAFVPVDILDQYVEMMETGIGKDSAMQMTIRPVGGIELI